MQWYKDYSSLYTVIILNLSPSSPPGGIKVLGRYETAAYIFLYQDKMVATRSNYNTKIASLQSKYSKH